MKKITAVLLLSCAGMVLALFAGCNTAPPAPENTVPENTAPESPAAEMPLYIPPPAVNPNPQMPLTVSILRRLGETASPLEGNIGRFQFVLSGKITMERDYLVRNDKAGEGEIPSFEDEHIKEIITFNDQTEGQAMAMSTERGRIVLSVCFEANDDYRLFFSCPEGEPDAYFQLDYVPAAPGELSNGEEKGTLVYAGSSFRLFTGETRPYLLINLSQRDIDTLNSRIAPGRRAGPL